MQENVVQEKVPRTNPTIVQTWHKMKGQIQPLKIPIEEEEKELTATPVFNKACVVRRPLRLRDQELFEDSAVNLEGELIHFAFIAEAESVEFEKAMTEEK
ncbi:hypothetical protein CR513_56096, partial [Mucuna pruriens]